MLEQRGVDGMDHVLEPLLPGVGGPVLQWQVGKHARRDRVDQLLLGAHVAVGGHRGGVELGCKAPHGQCVEAPIELPGTATAHQGMPSLVSAGW